MLLLKVGVKCLLINPSQRLWGKDQILIWRRGNWLESKAIEVATLAQQLSLRRSFVANFGNLCLKIIIFIIKWLTLVQRCDVLFQISQLWKRFAAILAFEGPATVVLAVMVLYVARLFESYHTSFEQTLKMCPKFVWCGIMNSNYLYHVGRNVFKFVFKILSNE